MNEGTRWHFEQSKIIHPLIREFGDKMKEYGLDVEIKLRPVTQDFNRYEYRTGVFNDDDEPMCPDDK